MSNGQEHTHGTPVSKRYKLSWSLNAILKTTLRGIGREWHERGIRYSVGHGTDENCGLSAKIPGSDNCWCDAFAGKNEILRIAGLHRRVSNKENPIASINGCQSGC